MRVVTAVRSSKRSQAKPHSVVKIIIPKYLQYRLLNVSLHSVVIST